MAWTKGMENEWLEFCKINKQLIAELKEKNILDIAKDIYLSGYMNCLTGNYVSSEVNE